MSARDIAFRIARHRYPRYTVITTDTHVYLINPLWGERGCVDIFNAAHIAEVMFKVDGPRLEVVKARSGTENGEDVVIEA